MLLLHLRRISVSQGGSSNLLYRLYKALVIQSNLATSSHLKGQVYPAPYSSQTAMLLPT